jgi:hypothetical protein
MISAEFRIALGSFSSLKFCLVSLVLVLLISVLDAPCLSFHNFLSFDSHHFFCTLKFTKSMIVNFSDVLNSFGWSCHIQERTFQWLLLCLGLLPFKSSQWSHSTSYHYASCFWNDCVLVRMTNRSKHLRRRKETISMIVE